MAEISSYPLKAPKLGDLLIFTETYDASEANPVVGNPTKNTTISDVLDLVPDVADGTIGYIPRFSSSNTISNSSIFEIGSGSIGIGTTFPTSKLQVVGIVEYADNSAALTAGLTAGAIYRTGDLIKIVH